MQTIAQYDNGRLEVNLDPAGQFTNASPEAIFEGCGFSPEWFAIESNNPDISAVEVIEKYYAHGGGWVPFGQGKWEFKDDGTLQYPEDPSLPPYITFRHNDEQVTIYAYGITRIGDEVARLD